MRSVLLATPTHPIQKERHAHHRRRNFAAVIFLMLPRSVRIVQQGVPLKKAISPSGGPAHKAIA